ncbi:hypothetical protein [Halioxenophilus sp. WMMB6]|uniref:hypothetical protein n=1 Tax=Halioxenophilus sp. WMMB6 TaxID=3073815 RepID=UPI00295E4338|nr:hypothetical protein [Halioxenophilus sp. WMMB6]
MIRLVLLGVVLFVVMYAIKQIRQQPPEKQKKLWLQSILLAAFITFALLALTGKLHWIGILLGALIPLGKTITNLAVRFLPFLALSRRQQRPFQARSTNTPYLQFVIDGRGDMGGLILKGSLAGKQLKDLSEQQLLAFQQECASCRDTQQLLAAYLNKYYPHRHRAYQHSAPPGTMSAKEAQQILGLEGNFNKQDVIAAHRRLINKLHPDRGGSDFLAAQINSAKDVLIKQFN